MADPVFGISIRKVDEGARPVLSADLSTIGLVGPAPLADPAIFPINSPVVLNSNDTTKTRKLGESGYLSDAVRGINDQLGETQFAARIVVVRTAEGTDPDPAIKLQQTISKIAGDSLNGTGMWAFLKSAQKLGCTPRILLAPGYTSQMANGVGLIERTVPGAGYVTDHLYPVTFSGGGPQAVQAAGHAYGLTDGTLGPIELELPGAWYTTPPTIEAPPAGRSVDTATIATGGIGYLVGEQLLMPDGVILGVATVAAGGAVLTATVVAPGFMVGTEEPEDLPVEPTSSTGAGTGASFTYAWEDTGTLAEYEATLVAGANPVVASATPICNQLLGQMIVEVGRLIVAERPRLARDDAEPSPHPPVGRLPRDGPRYELHPDPAVGSAHGWRHGAARSRNRRTVPQCGEPSDSGHHLAQSRNRFQPHRLRERSSGASRGERGRAGAR